MNEREQCFPRLCGFMLFRLLTPCGGLTDRCVARENYVQRVGEDKGKDPSECGNP